MSIESFGDLRRIVAGNREIKKEAKEKGVTFDGQRGFELIDYATEIDGLAQVMFQSHLEWAESKFDSLREYLKDVSREDIEEAFFRGLKTNITQYFRVYKKTGNSDVIKQLHDPAFQNKLVESFFIDFVLTLRKSGKGKTSPITALKLARQSYIHDPDIVSKLQKQFPETDLGLIVRAAVAYPHTSAEFIARTEENIITLAKEFPDVDPNIIRTAAVSNHRGDPASFIRKVQDGTTALSKKFPDVDMYVIKAAALGRPKRIEAFIAEVAADITRLTGKFPDVKRYIIKTAAAFHRDDPDAFIESVQRNIPILTAKFPDLPSHDIETVAVCHFGRATERLEEIRAKRLNKKT
ncbi:MAG: hypothetical protein A2538_03685 [Candidatus Magasanikbacteria bacterium RIFOXYD2_FULL_41_14]|uniref:Uncharacterized protein n=1 Tax=Candidatus Magasanikbacteria bacterium RIFOXYD2_FULL_41_14 TaxID=1798709 RepID=A0A1F6PD06_9BACT|nr:MAG: hypothetical protein A2538_03685 [Candidatus Magasanikbacteria bacterium RIFOXYD2_FULL_41_14]